MLTLDEQCKRDRGTNACFVSLASPFTCMQTPSPAHYNDCLRHQIRKREWVEDTKEGYFVDNTNGRRKECEMNDISLPSDDMTDTEERKT